MNTVATQIRVNAEIKKSAKAIFDQLGLDFSSAVNLFLFQCVLRGGLPFAVEVPNYNKETLLAMSEAKSVSRDPNAKEYADLEELKKDLED